MSRKDMIQKVRKTPWLTVAVFTVFTVLSLMATMPLLGCEKSQPDQNNADDEGRCAYCAEPGPDHPQADCGTVGHRTCVGNHNVCENCGKRYCDTTAHKARDCGIHFDCIGDTINKLEGDHETKLNCGNFVCMDGHEACSLCGNCACTGDHGIGKCKKEEPSTDDIQPTEVTGPVCPNCKNSVNVEMEHKNACGHWSCAEGFNVEGHQQLECGHWTCAEGFDAAGHTQCVCGTWLCGDGVDLDTHRERGCGHRECEKGTHEQCDSCGAWMCKYENERYRLECGHYVCDECDLSAHEKKECGCFACDDDCDHKEPETPATIYCANGCGAVVSYAEEHKCTSPNCGDYICNTNVHNYNTDCKVHYECQLFGNPIHQIFGSCQKPICNNTSSHTELDCKGHYKCADNSTAINEDDHKLLDCNVHYKCEVDSSKHSEHSAGAHNTP